MTLGKQLILNVDALQYALAKRFTQESFFS